VALTAARAATTTQGSRRVETRGASELRLRQQTTPSTSSVLFDSLDSGTSLLESAIPW
jgi:hypothetical protein